jgi:hypothetical protein
MKDRARKQLCTVHRLVALAFLPMPEQDQTQVNHLDGDKTHNRVANLAWASPSENMKHAVATGLSKGPPTAFGSLHPNAKLTEAEVMEIVARRRKGERLTHLAQAFGVCVSTIHAITSRQNWRHI